MALISRSLAFVVANFQSADLNSALSLDGGKPFALDGADPQGAVERLRQTITASSGAGR